MTISKLILILSTATLLSCTSVPPVVPPVVPVPVPAPVPSPVPSPVVPAVSIEKIVAANPACTSYSWKNRGRATVGYIKGMAASYQRSLCRYNSAGKTPAGVMGQNVGDAYKDVLAHYGLNAPTGGERIKQVYTLLIGLGMRESSGWYGCGRDTSADNVQVDTAETGLFQFSYNLNSASPMLDVLYKEYKADESKCLLSVFKEGFTKPASSDFYGTGEGRYFQELARRCPAFAAEYTAVGVRVLRRHWGPLNRKEAEYLPACEKMLSQVEAATVCK